MSQAVVFVLLCVAFALADPPIPNCPSQFKSAVKITTEGFFPTTAYGTYYYDFSNRRERIETTIMGDLEVQVMDYAVMESYEWDTQARKCECAPISDPEVPLIVPYGSIYVGQAVIGTTTTDVWSFQNPIMNQAGIFITYYVDSNGFVIRTNNTVATEWDSQTILVDFSNIIVGAPDPSLFQPATFCNCPAPPPVPTPGSCPSNPGSACQCASTSSLSFCTLVNYPISNTIAVAETDAFVQQAYNAAVMVLPNPSQACLSNYKAFLCAFFFNECAGNDNPFTFLPCANICPFCNCGGLVDANCTSAATGTTCTMYGTAACSSF